MSTINRTRKNAVLTLTFDRPNSLNAFDDDLRGDLMTALADVEDDDTVRCVVLQGAGKAFSAGGDIGMMKSRFEREVTAAEFEAHVSETAHELVGALYDLTVPTIAKVDGIAVGMGLSIALACDIVVSSDDARFGATFTNVGLGPDTGVSYTLPRYIGPHVALELIYTGRIVESEWAEAHGLVNRTVPAERVDEVVTDIAEKIAQGPTAALAAAKDLVHGNADRNFEDALDAEAATQALLYTTEDHREGVQAFLKNRDPVFKGK